MIEAQLLPEALVEICGFGALAVVDIVRGVGFLVEFVH